MKCECLLDVFSRYDKYMLKGGRRGLQSGGMVAGEVERKWWKETLFVHKPYGDRLL